MFCYEKNCLNYCDCTSDFVLLNFESIAEDSLKKLLNQNETELKFFTGMFDFSDDKQSSGLLVYNIKMKNCLETVFWENYLQLLEVFLQKKVRFTFIRVYRQNMNLDF